MGVVYVGDAPVAIAVVPWRGMCALAEAAIGGKMVCGPHTPLWPGKVDGQHLQPGATDLKMELSFLVPDSR